MDDKVVDELLNEPNASAFGLHQGNLVKIFPVIRSEGNALIVETSEVLRNL